MPQQDVRLVQSHHAYLPHNYRIHEIHTKFTASPLPCDPFSNTSREDMGLFLAGYYHFGSQAKYPPRPKRVQPATLFTLLSVQLPVNSAPPAYFASL